MIIAYDLRYAADRFSGIATLAHGLFEGLLAESGDERYVAIWDPRLEQTRFDFGPMRKDPRVRWVDCDVPPTDVTTAWRTGALLRALGPDVFLSPFHVLPHWAGCPCVLTVHDVRPLRTPSDLPWPRRVMATLALLSAARAERILTVSQFSRDEMVALSNIDSSRVRVVQAGVARLPEDLVPSRPRAVPERPFALVVGENRPHKNLEVLARTWALFGESPALDLVWAGPIQQRYDDLVTLAARHGARGVMQLGWVSEAEREWLYTHAQLLLFPSLYEGFGSPLVEGMRHGLPVIAARIGALVEVGGDAVRYCDPRDARAWFMAIRDLVEDSDARERMRAAGLARSQLYSYTRAARETLAVLRELVGGAGGHA